MSDVSLASLAEASGVAPRWQDFQRHWHDVTPDTLRAVLAALGIPAATDGEIADGLARQRETAGLPPLLTAEQDEWLALAGPCRVELEGGGSLAGDGGIRVGQPGYHRLIRGDQAATLAVAPRHCHPLPPGRPWGIAAQLYSLRRAGDGGIGDFRALADFVRAAARHGADAVAISPVHAQFSADPDRFSPYAPSSRVMSNVLHASADGDATLEADALVDWPAAARLRLAQFRRRFEAGIDEAGLSAFRAEMGEPLERHARFEALHAHFYGRDPGRWSWRTWPAEYRDPASDAVASFAADHRREVRFHAWLQMLADSERGEAQKAARDAGMRIGLISDLAVGADGGGSHAWSRQGEMMIGLSIGAPPDLLNGRGQNWGISAFTPLGLRRHGYSAYVEMLRAALRHSGGVRIDHAMGLQRLWVIPNGGEARDGAYLTFPVDDMLRLLALESVRQEAVVLAEDLGTLPDGFQDRLIARDAIGMRVLWFERDGDRFRPPREWPLRAAAMTSTHDLPTVAGWWRGRDVAWRGRLHLTNDPDQEAQARERDRALLWQAMCDSGAAAGEQPGPEEASRAAGAGLAHVAHAGCALALLPLEDVLACEEQPNLPGTTTQHPNWRRRLPGPAADLLEPPEVAARLDAVRQARGG